jgi:outer membrane protein OmpA-like peptidoglycan-associated protein
MNFKFAATSLMALALFAVPVIAQEQQPAAEEPATEQPAQEQPAAEQPAAEAPAALPEEIAALVNDRRTSQELSDDELKQRAKLARKFAKTAGLPDDVKSQLQALVDSDRAELEARAQAAKPAEQPVEEKKAEPVEQPAEEKKAEPVQEAAPQPEEAPKAAEIPQEVTDLLSDGRPLEELSVDDLKARAKFARQQSRNEALPEDVRAKLAEIGKDARQALVAREKPAEEKKAEEPAPQPEPQKAEEPAPKVEEPPQQAEQPAPKAEEPVQQEAAPAVQPEQPVVVEPPKAAETAPQPEPAPVVDKVEAKELDGNKGTPEAEAKARVFLDDATPAESLDDAALRTRLDGMRDLMAENELSVKTERALRQKLRAERDVLRDRIAKAKAEEEAKALAAKAAEEAKQPQAEASAGEQPAQTQRRKKKINVNIIINADTPIRDVLADRRAAEDMEESELRYRVRAWRDFERSDDYQSWDQDEVASWRERNRRDRQYLRRVLEEDRNIRRVELEKPSNIRRIVIEDDGQFEDDIPEDIFAAEVEDEDIERAILAPPRKKITRKIRVEEIAEQPRYREALTRIEVDTIRFGFNEAFVREEEVDNLDQIASVIERVLKKYPREVFLIEGHTDAVGSDAYNAKLSKARAEAVKKALSTFYIIPAKNLKTVGLGERYLKIPTAEAEAENRRVSISRATALVGEAQD